MFEIKFDAQPEKILNKVDSNLRKRILDKIKSLEEKPIPSDAKIVQGRKEKTFRVRVGNYRILYVVFYEDKTILIAKIDKRSRAYM